MKWSDEIKIRNKWNEKFFLLKTKTKSKKYYIFWWKIGSNLKDEKVEIQKNMIVKLNHPHGSLSNFDPLRIDETVIDWVYH